jgi:hypothetical protein
MATELLKIRPRLTAPEELAVELTPAGSTSSALGELLKLTGRLGRDKHTRGNRVSELPKEVGYDP